MIHLTGITRHSNDGVSEPTVSNTFLYDKYFLTRCLVTSAAIAYGLKIILVFINRIACVLDGVTDCFHSKFLSIF